MSVISKLVAEHCPSLHSLGLFPGVRLVRRPNGSPIEVREEDDGEHPSLSLMLGNPFYYYLGTMRNLRFLTTNTTLMNPAPLLSLSQLPFLESLDIYSSFRSSTANILEVPLLQGSFPTLKHLVVRFLDIAELLMLWNILPVVEKLTRLEFQFNLFRLGDSNFMAGWFSSTFFPLVCSRSPHVNNLTIAIADGDSERDDPFELKLHFFEQMAQLPLQYVSLRWLACCVADTGTFYTRLGAIWPAVIELRFPEEHLYPEDLHHFAALPKLEHLTISLGCPQGWNPSCLSQVLSTHGPLPLRTLKQEGYEEAPIPTEYAKPIVKYVWAYIIQQNHFIMVMILESNITSTFERNARHLLSFWPNLQDFSCPSLGYSAATQMSFKIMEDYASKLKMLREIRNRITAQFGPEAAQAMVPSRFDYL